MVQTNVASPTVTFWMLAAGHVGDEVTWGHAPLDLKSSRIIKMTCIGYDRDCILNQYISNHYI